MLQMNRTMKRMEKRTAKRTIILQGRGPVPNATFLSEEQTSDYSCLKMQMWTKKWTYEGGY